MKSLTPGGCLTSSWGAVTDETVTVFSLPLRPLDEDEKCRGRAYRALTTESTS